MADPTISPNMNLPIPVPAVTPGPDWATDVVADMNAIDSHDHSAGKGVPITPDGLNINNDLPLNDNDLTEVRSVNFTAQGAPLAAPDDLGCLYVSGADLYYNDENGNQVRITQSGSVTGSSGTITGLPSGTASASFGGGAFTFQSSTSTPATMNVGPLVIGRQVASSKTVTLAPNAGQASNFSLTFPAALPASTQVQITDSSGNMSYKDTTGTGDVVLAASPAISNPVIAGVVSAADGNSSAPSYTFTGDTDTGIYHTTNALHFAADATESFYVDAGGAQAVFGVAGHPGYSFLTDTDTGMYRSAINQLGFATSGVPRLTIDSDGAQILSGGVGTDAQGTGSILKWKVFTGSFAGIPNGSAAFNVTAPGTLMGYVGVFQSSSTSNRYRPLAAAATGITETLMMTESASPNRLIAESTFSTLQNGDYRITLFYQ